MSIIANPNIDANLFFTHHNLVDGVIGIAWHSSMCYGDYKYRASIVEYFKSDLVTAEVIA